VGDFRGFHERTGGFFELAEVAVALAQPEVRGDACVAVFDRMQVCQYRVVDVGGQAPFGVVLQRLRVRHEWRDDDMDIRLLLEQPVHDSVEEGANRRPVIHRLDGRAHGAHAPAVVGDYGPAFFQPRVHKSEHHKPRSRRTPGGIALVVRSDFFKKRKMSQLLLWF